MTTPVLNRRMRELVEFAIESIKFLGHRSQVDLAVDLVPRGANHHDVMDIMKVLDSHDEISKVEYKNASTADFRVKTLYYWAA